MQRNYTRYLGPKDCRFTLNGTNIAEMRRAKLQKIAKACGLQGVVNQTKQDVLRRLIGHFSAHGFPDELTER